MSIRVSTGGWLPQSCHVLKLRGGFIKFQADESWLVQVRVQFIYPLPLPLRYGMDLKGMSILYWPESKCSVRASA
jgi:hypothetical protein